MPVSKGVAFPTVRSSYRLYYKRQRMLPCRDDYNIMWWSDVLHVTTTVLADLATAALASLVFTRTRVAPACGGSGSGITGEATLMFICTAVTPNPVYQLTRVNTVNLSQFMQCCHVGEICCSYLLKCLQCLRAYLDTNDTIKLIP